MHPICRALFFILPLVFAAAPSAAADLPDGLYARFDTDKGEIVAELYYKDTPLTVANFVGLAEGKLDSDVRRGQPFYDGLIFHRVVPGFVIQGGDPEGSGYGGPGYRFADEFAPDLKHDGPGMLSMANAGPNSNGSQFFITHAPTPHLDSKHSVFGKVISGMETVNAIARGDAIRSLTILRVGADAQTFQVTQKMFQDLQAAKAGIVSEADAPATEAEWAERIARYTQDAVTAPSGLKYVVLTQGSGDKPRKGQQVQAQYTGRFLDGAVFDSSVGRAPFAFSVGSGQVIRGWDEAILDMRVGEKRALIVPPGLAYGSRGAGGVIPPNATLFFEVERLR